MSLRVAPYSFIVTIVVAIILSQAAIGGDNMADLQQQAAVRQRPKTADVLLTNDIKHRREIGSFDRKDTIYAVVTKISDKGAHVLEAKWLDSRGQVLQTSIYEFEIKTYPVDAWVTWERDPGTGGRLFADFDPFAVSGVFKVKIYLDKKLIDEKEFFIQ